MPLSRRKRERVLREGREAGWGGGGIKERKRNERQKEEKIVAGDESVIKAID